MSPASLYRRLSLRTRITISFVLLMAGAMGFIVLAEQVDYDQVRAAVIAWTQDSAVQKLQGALARGEHPALPSGSQLYDSNSVPMVLRQYGPGYHGEAAPNEWHLRVFDSDGQRYYLLQDAAPYGYLEHMINAFAALVISICVLGAFLIGRKVATHVIAPITRLADAVQDGQKPFPYQDARDEIGVLARAFARHSDELERFLHREQCFSGDASHELRTPLAIIGGAAETLACHLPADSHLVPSAERILRTTQEMQRQLTCLLLLSRAPSTVPRNQVALRPLIESCMERCEPWLSGKPVIVAFDALHDTVLDTNANLAQRFRHRRADRLQPAAQRLPVHRMRRSSDHPPRLRTHRRRHGPRPALQYRPTAVRAFPARQPAQWRGTRAVDRAAHRRASGLEDDGAFVAAGMPVQPGVAPLTVS